MSFPAGPDDTGSVRVCLGGRRSAFHVHAVQVAGATRVEPPSTVQLLTTIIFKHRATPDNHRINNARLLQSYTYRYEVESDQQAVLYSCVLAVVK